MSGFRTMLIEDEPPAREHLRRLLSRISPTTTIVGEAGSCSEALEWFQTHPPPELIFCDIQLSDGNALTIFEKRPAPAPVVFCTAYDQFVLRALDAGGVDYLLKPVTEERLHKAMNKLEQIARPASSQQDVAPLLQVLGQLSAAGQRRFVVRRGPVFSSVPVGDVAYFTAEHKLTRLVERDGQSAYLDESLAQLEPELLDMGWFRMNRAFLVSRDAVASFRAFTKGRLDVELSPPTGGQVLISAQNAAAFKSWLAGRRA